jgi:gamma-D-glutamyl-L-lysine dipeptidyl-peptidase
MRAIRPRGLLVAVALFSIVGCGRGPLPAPEVRGDGVAHQVPAFLSDTLAVIRANYAPDRRVARFDVEIAWPDGAPVLEGTTDQPEAMDRLVAALAGHGLAWEDRVRRLPARSAVGPGWAIVNNAVANLRSEPRHAAELASQAPLGTPLRVLDRNEGWLLVQAPDGYIAWVDGGGVELVREAELEALRVADRVIYLRPAGPAWSEPRAGSLPVADLVAGALLARLSTDGDFHHVRFPDGRTAFIHVAESAPYADWVAAIQATEEALVSVSLSLLGRPYLWGGTSPHGMDCSGFTKTVYLLNGLVLPRDASQQVHAGEVVDEARDWTILRPGDLLFFGRPATATSPERVVHVGMWLGDGRFIHSSGRVRIDSVDPADPLYDEYNVGRYLRTRRILGSSVGVHRLADDALYPRDGRFPPAATAGPATRGESVF